MTFVVLITASREWKGPHHRTLMEIALLQTWREAGQPHGFTVRHGAAKGGDTLAEEISLRRGWKTDRHPVHPTTWRTLGKRAGFVRNEHMVNLGADVCLAFILHCTQPGCHRPQPHGTHGATGCAKLTLKTGIPTEVYRACRDNCPCVNELPPGVNNG